MCSNGFKTCSNVSNVFQPVQNLFKCVQNCSKIIRVSSARGPTWQAELDLVLIESLMVFWNISNQNPRESQIQSKEGKTASHNFSEEYNLTLAFKTRNLAPHLSALGPVVKYSLHSNHFTSNHVSIDTIPPLFMFLFQGAFFSFSIEYSSHWYLVSESDSGIYWLIYMFIFR